ncbi:MAG: type VI secretion system accessory protein TagJ [Planctomycetota bacterium]|nr:type VI secretion system accessory protein TagJ [Planctomycetota bacterium]
MGTLELFNEGQLAAAITSATTEVKASPTDLGRRSLLADLLCFTADYDRADKQLEAISKLEPKAMTVVTLTRQLIRAETWRQDFYREGRTPEFLSTPTERVQLQLRASIALREGEQAEAADLLSRAEGEREAQPCSAEGQQHEDVRDFDDLVGGVLEIFTSTGKYYWVPMETVTELEPRPIERPRDLLWPRFRLEVKGGPEGEVYMPALYGPMPAEASEELLLGRVSEFSEADPVRGQGRRQFLLGDDAVSVNDVPFLQFSNSAPE